MLKCPPQQATDSTCLSKTVFVFVYVHLEQQIKSWPTQNTSTHNIPSDLRHKLQVAVLQHSAMNSTN